MNRKHQPKVPRGKGRKKPQATKSKTKSRLPPQTKHSTAYVKQRVVPSETDVVLREDFPLSLLTSFGNQGVAEHFYLNSMLHGSPSVLNTAVGLTNYTSLYNTYRVVKVTYDINVTNTTAGPIEVVDCCSNIDPGTAYANYFTLSMNELGRKTQLSPVSAGGCTHKISRTVMMSQIAGTSNVETDDTFRAAINADPADFLWLGIGILLPTGTTFAVGVGAAIQLTRTWTVRFYGRAELTSFQVETATTEERTLYLWRLKQKEIELSLMTTKMTGIPKEDKVKEVPKGLTPYMTMICEVHPKFIAD